MFDRVVVHGRGGALVWGYQTAVEIARWRIVRAVETKGAWTLQARVSRVDGFIARQRPLVFTAPRVGGVWAFPIRDLQLGTEQLRATVGPPER